jgi:hypothetical protein
LKHYNIFEARSKREKIKKMYREVCEREGILNDEGFDPHHCFFRSEYGKLDWNEEWNIEPVKRGFHDSIHQDANKKLEIYYKKKALLRYSGLFREELESIIKRKSHAIR